MVDSLKGWQAFFAYQPRSGLGEISTCFSRPNIDMLVRCCMQNFTRA